jgi:hypothetical protein
MAACQAVKAERAKAHAELLSARYPLSVTADPVVRMSSGKPVPVGPAAKLSGVTGEPIDDMTPQQIKEKRLFPAFVGLTVYLYIENPSRQLGSVCGYYVF